MVNHRQLFLQPKHINMNKSIHDKIAHQQLTIPLLIVENITEYTRERSGENIGSESQNALTVYETQWKTKQFPFNIAHLITSIHSTWHFLQQEKFAVSGCKTKQFLLQAMVYNFFPGKKPLQLLTFKYLNKTLDRLGSPQRMNFPIPKNVSSSHFIFCTHS